MTNLPFGVQYSTSSSLASLEDWLTNNCRGEWDVRLVDIGERLGKKKVNIYFELEGDKDIFKGSFTQQKTG